MMTVEEAIVGRHSVRAYLDRPVARETIEKILRIASRAPSGTNIQPWHGYVLQGARKDALSAELLRVIAAGEKHPREYSYYPEEWREPYLARRRACGFGLYNTLGIKRGEAERMKAQHNLNFTFFGAPVALMFSIDSYLEKGSWLDYGMFVQSVMLAARGEGLETCPQAALAYYPHVVKRIVGIPDNHTFVCSITLGYEDNSAPVNTFITEREPVDQFMTWLD